MPRVQPLSAAEIERALAQLKDWQAKNGRLHAEFRFENFIEAFTFMTRVALAAEGMHHHPEWSNVYNRVTIDLVTRDAGDQISQLDVDLAGKISALAAAR